MVDGWTLGSFAQPSQSTTPISPQQAAAIRNTTAAMSQPTMPTYSPPAQNQAQQNTMFNALMNWGGKNNQPVGNSMVPDYGQTANAVGYGAGTGGLSFPMFMGQPASQ